MESRGLTQTVLAEEASLLRGGLNAILVSGGSVRESTSRKMRGALDVSIDEIMVGAQASNDSYPRLLSERYGGLDFRGCSSTNVWPLALRDLFVPLRVSGESRGPEREKECDEDRAGASLDCYSETAVGALSSDQGLIDYVNRYDRVYLKGEPGSGKTTCLRHIVLQYAQEEVPGKSGRLRGVIPLLVPLAEYERAIESESIPNTA